MKTNAQIMLNEAVHCRIHQIIREPILLTSRTYLKMCLYRQFSRYSSTTEFCTGIICRETFVYSILLLFLNLTIMKISS